MKGHECELQNIDAEAVQITELITGICNTKLREECLKLKNPRLTDLVDLGLQFDLADSVKKENFGSEEASAFKTSEHQISKKKNWNAAKAESPKSGKRTSDENSGNNSRNNSEDCQSCGYWDCPKKPCKFSEKFCSLCGKKGHSSKACSKRTAGSSDNANAKTVHVSKVSAKVVADTKKPAAKETAKVFKNRKC